MAFAWHSASLTACLAFLGGVGMGSAMIVDSGLVTSVRLSSIVVVLLLVVGAIAYALRRPLGVVAAIACVAGVLRLLAGVPPAGAHGTWEGAAVTVAGTVTHARETSRGDVVVRMAPTSVWLPGSGREPVVVPRPVDCSLRDVGASPRYGDVVEATCQWRTPTRTGDQLTVAGRCFARHASDVHVIAGAGGSALLRRLGEWRAAARTRLERRLTEPAASIVNGLLLGIDRRLPNGLTEAFRRTGTAHILVVSGWHMSMLGIVARNWLLRTGIPRATGLLLAGLTVAAFTAAVGFSPSATRGCLTVVALLLVDGLGRLANPVRVLIIVAAAMVAIDPEILGFDVGFQLSMAATAGILLGQPLLERWLARIRGLRSAWGAPLRSLIAASTAAALATTPITAGTFGTIALLAPFVNLPVLLLTVPLTIVGLVLLVLDAAFPPLASILSWVATAIANAITAIVAFAGAIPWAALPAHRFDPWFTSGVLLLLAAAVRFVSRRYGIRMLSPFAIVVRDDRS